MMGLSAQDSNIQAFFAKAESVMRWPWPGNKPSFVFSGEQVGADQEGLLKNVYPETYTAATRDQINEQSLVRAYANPLLLALVLSVIADKMQVMVDTVQGNLDPAARAALQQGVVALRDHLATLDNGDRLQFVRKFVDHASRTMTMFRDGAAGVTALCQSRCRSPAFRSTFQPPSSAKARRPISSLSLTRRSTPNRRSSARWKGWRARSTSPAPNVP
ncbi:hypothetical protein EN879_30260 [Mesorhizobium sp. M7A.F.Ca.AU.002.02.1.1]|nr:hypothetical protein EN879_30260 [Mesorhizobium sp. M7A.F.Ca.AU.002.02.1.1]